MSFLILTLATLLLCLQQSRTQDFVLVKVYDQTGQAKCLDGTPPALYYRKGISSDKWIVYFEGGAWCGGATLSETIEDCYQRSLTDLGSSKNYPQTASNQGILSGDSSQNPYFYNYNVVWFRYCDGTGHQGYREDPITYNNIQLWFRGQKNVELLFEYAYNVLGLNAAKEVVIAGSSAGALATFYWVDTLASKFNSQTTTVYGIPDSGIFLDVINYSTGQYSYRILIQNFMNIANKYTSPLITDCVNDYPNEQWKCLMAQYLPKYIKTPLFVIISEYDQYSIPNILGIDCVSNAKLNKCSKDQKIKIEAYRTQTIQALQEYQSIAGASGWSPACINHCYMTYYTFTSNSYTIPMYTLNTLSYAIHQWRNGSKKFYMDDMSWPENIPCSNV